MPGDVMLAAAARQSGGRAAKLLHFAVAFLMSSFERVQLRQYTLQCVLLSSGEGKGGNEENTL